MRRAGCFWTLVYFLAACTSSRQTHFIEQGDKRTFEGKYAESAEYFRKAIALNPENEAGLKALYKLGYVSESYLEDFDTAIVSYNEFIRNSRASVSVYEVQKRLANIYFDHKQDSEKSVVSYKNLLTMAANGPESDLFQFRIAQSYFRINNFEQARIEYENLLGQFPRSSYVPRARYEIANSYYMEAKYDSALDALKQVVRNHRQHEFGIEAEYL